MNIFLKVVHADQGKGLNDSFRKQWGQYFMADTFKVEQINGVSKLRPMVFSVLFGNKEEKNILEDEHRTTKCSKKVRYIKTKNTQRDNNKMTFGDSYKDLLVVQQWQ